MEVIKQAGWSTTPVELYFYRDTDKREVDLVVEAASGDVVAIEAKAAAATTASDVRGLRVLRDKLGPRFKTGVVVYSGEHTLPIEDRIWAMPISGLWTQAGGLSLAAVRREASATPGGSEREQTLAPHA